MKRFFLPILLIIIIFAAGFEIGWFARQYVFQSRPAVRGESIEKTFPLKKYALREIANRPIQSSEIIIDKILTTHSEFTSYLIHYTSDGKKISGVLNVPAAASATNSAFPVIVMARGFVAEEGYESGKGTQDVAVHFAQNGFVTIAPDFLGFGQSDDEPSDPLEARFIKPIAIIDVLHSLPQYDQTPLLFKDKPVVRINQDKIGLWGHSNGGQIALSVLEITKRNIPTVLWAPVTKPFPYSVLYFTDESEDLGKGLRAMLAEFEKEYDISEFSIGNDFSQVNAKMQLHQGTNDDAVPKDWSDDFHSLLVGKGKKDAIEYFVYQGADHALYPNRDQAVSRSIGFFQKELNVEKKFEQLLK